MKERLTLIKAKQYIQIFDEIITLGEITKSVKGFKNKYKKACGLDSVSNETIKCSFDAMSNVQLSIPFMWKWLICIVI